MPADPPDPLLEKMKARVRAGGGSRSKLSVWMAERQDQIAKLIAEAGADWDGWAEDFVAADLMQPPSGWGQEGPDGAAARRRAAETARMTWARLRKRKAGGRAVTKAKPASVASETRVEAPGVTREGETPEQAAVRRAQAIRDELRNRSK